MKFSRLFVMFLTFSLLCDAQENKISLDEKEYIEIREKIEKRDTIIDNIKMIDFTKYQTINHLFNPLVIDSLCISLYNLNQEKKYSEAITKGNELLKLCPNSLTGHKELSRAYKNYGNVDLSKSHFKMMVKILNSIMDNSNGSYEQPFILNNCYEGISLYEATYSCTVNGQVLMLDKTNRLLCAYKGYSSVYDEIFIKYVDANFMKELIDEGDYIIED